MPPQGQQPNPTDQTTNFFWGMILLTGLGVLIWFLDKTYIVRFVFLIRGAEITAALSLTAALNTLLSWVYLPQIHLPRFAYWHNYVISHYHSPKLVGFSDLVKLSNAYGRWWRYPVAAVMAGLSLFLYFRSKENRFTQSYSMKSLCQLEVKNWPQITPIIDLDLAKQDITKGPWAMSDRPLSFGRKHNIIEPVELGKNEVAVWKVKRGPAHRVFVMQMGPLWRGVNYLPSHLQALFAIFLARTEGDTKTARDLIYQIAASSNTGKLNFTGVAELLEKYQNSRVLKWLEGRHAYVSTFMMTLLEIARVDGVLASAEFLWLKPVDRRFWYALNSVGRQTAFVEVAGIFSHWLAEKKVGKPMQVPMVKEAVNAYEEAMKQVLYIPEGEEWLSKGG